MPVKNKVSLKQNRSWLKTSMFIEPRVTNFLKPRFLDTKYDVTLGIYTYPRNPLIQSVFNLMKTKKKINRVLYWLKVFKNGRRYNQSNVTHNPASFPHQHNVNQSNGMYRHLVYLSDLPSSTSITVSDLVLIQLDSVGLLFIIFFFHHFWLISIYLYFVTYTMYNFVII